MSLTEIASSQPQRESLKLMTLEYTNVSEGTFVEEPVVELFCRNGAGERRQINVHDYYPHFYISESEFIEYKDVLLQEPKIRSIAVDERIISDVDGMNAAIDPVDGAPRTTLEGTDLVKIYTVTPADVSDLRGGFDQHWEADVFFTNRFLVDSGIKLGISVPEGKTDVSFDEIEVLDDGEEPDIRPRLLTVDIEVWSGGEFPDTTDPDKPVTAITAHDSYDDEYFCGILHPDSVKQGSAHTWEDDIEWCAPDGLSDDDLVVNVYHDEVELLAAFNEFVIEKDPDLLTGWNSSRNDMGSGFDYPYLINRCDRLNEWTVQELSYDNGATFVTSRGRANIAGREMFDMLQAYKKTQIHEKRSYALGYIADQELGYGKEDIDGLDEGWLHNPVEFMRYNIRDTQAVIEIEQAKSVLEMYDHIRSITGTTYSEIADSNIGIIDVLFLRQAKERGYALPTSEEPETQHYWGAYVFDPVPGKHRNVVYPDLSCFTPDHEVVTTDGIKQITEISTDDVVYSINPDTGTIEKKPVIETYRYPEYSGKTVTFSGTRVDFEVTPNHRMLYEMDGTYSFEEAGKYDGERRLLPRSNGGVDGSGIEVFDLTDHLDSDLYDVVAEYDEHGHSYRSKLPDGCEKKRANYHEGFFFSGDTFDEYKGEIEALSESVHLSHPSGGGSTFRPYKFDGDSFIEFIGWFITEGSTYYPDGKNTASVKVAQEKFEDEVRSCFESLGTRYSDYDGGFTIGSEVYARFLDRHCGSRSSEKRIPEFIFSNASVEQKRLLLNTMMRGDGHGNIYYTSSECLADDIIRLAVECGKKVKKNCRRENEYEVHITETNDGITEEMHSIDSTDSGVYCIEVADNNTMLAGRSGKFQWVGNSLYPNLFRDMNASPETIIGDESDLRDSSYSKDDCHTIYVDERSEAAKKAADEPVRSERYVLKPDVKESFVRGVISDLIQLKYKYKSDEYPDEAYAAAKRITNSCFTPDTEVMTPDGIKKITDVEVGDDVYSLNPDTHQIQSKSVTEVISKPDYDGELVSISNNTIDLKVTPDHRIYTKRPRYSDEFEVVDAGDLNNWTSYELPSSENVSAMDGERLERVNLLDYYYDEYEEVTEEERTFIRKDSTSSKIPKYIEGDKFIQLVGWYAAEGYSRSSGDGTGHQSIICQKNADGRKEIAELLDSCSLEFSSSKNGHIVSNEIFRKAMDNACGVGSENKRLPEVVFQMSVEQRKLLFETLEKGDGDTDPDSHRYSTKSETLRDQVAQLATSLGMDVQYRYDESGENNTGVWRIHYGEKKKTFRMKRSDGRDGDGGTESADNGVYCVQVEDNHTLVAGRNGKFSHIPQCYGVMGDSVSYGKGFRLFDWRIAEAITLAGRDVIKHTADEFVNRVKSMGYANAEIIAGDTDSCVCEVPSADGLEETLEVAQEAAEYVDMTYDDFMHNRFGIEDGNMAVEIESYAETALFMEKKKRYAQRIRWDEGEYVDSVEYKGFELVRSDSAEITGEVQRGVIDRILKEDDPKSAVSTYLRNEWSAVLDGEIDHDQLGIPSAINNELGDYGWTVNELDEDDVPLERDGEELEEGDEVVKYYTSQPNIRGARYANSHIEGEDISQGDKPLMFYVKRVDPTKESYPEVYEYDHTISLNAPRSKPDMNEREMKELERPVDAIAVNDVCNLDGHIRIDYEKMANRTIRKTVEPIVQVMGWSFDDLTTVGEQSGLGAYM